jgi:hypothetical protein
MVYRPSTHDILTHLPMVYQTLSYGIVNSSLLVEMRGGGSIYHEGVQNTMTKIGPQGFSVRFFQPVYSI